MGWCGIKEGGELCGEVCIWFTLSFFLSLRSASCVCVCVCIRDLCHAMTTVLRLCTLQEIFIHSDSL